MSKASVAPKSVPPKSPGKVIDLAEWLRRDLAKRRKAARIRKQLDGLGEKGGAR